MIKRLLIERQIIKYQGFIHVSFDEMLNTSVLTSGTIETVIEALKL